jgi:hypothetical protein
MESLKRTGLWMGLICLSALTIGCGGSGGGADSADGRLLHDIALPNPGYNGNDNGLLAGL